MTLSARNKHHAMTALANLAKYTGRYDHWLQLRHRYNLKWSKGDSIASFERFFDDGMNYDVMLQRIKEMIQKLPAQMGTIIKFDCLTGLRPAEAVASVWLINDKEHAFAKYYKPERMALEHFRFPEVFFRQTKKAYISFVSPEILDIAKSCGHNISYNDIRLACWSKGIKMDMRFCRKIYASHLRQFGIESEIVDLLQGRVPRTVFARHYLVVKPSYKNKVLRALNKLKLEIE
jgi:intergrase/recombinase